MRIGTLLRYELKHVLADRRALALLFLAPLLLLFLVGYALSPLLAEEALIEKFDVALVNEDQAWETKTLIRQIQQAEDIQKILRFKEVTRSEAERLLSSNTVAAAVIIPAGFSEDLTVGKNTPVEVIGNPRRPLQAEMFHTFMQSGADLISAAQSGVNTVYLYMSAAGVSAAELQQIFAKTVVQFTMQALSRTKVLDKEILSAYGDLSRAEYYAVALGLLFVFLLGLAQVQPLEHNLVLQRLLVAGLPIRNVLLAKWLAVSLLLAIPYTIYFALLVGVMENIFRGNLFLFICISLLSLATIGAFYLCLAVLCTRVAVLQLVGLLSCIGLALLGGGLVPLVYLPVWLQDWQWLSVFSWAMKGLIYALFTTEKVSWLMPAGVLVLFCLLSLVLAKRLARVVSKVL